MQKEVTSTFLPSKKTVDLRILLAEPGGARRSPAEPAHPAQASPWGLGNASPHARTARKAGRLPQGQTPSNYYYYYYYYY